MVKIWHSEYKCFKNVYSQDLLNFTSVLKQSFMTCFPLILKNKIIAKLNLEEHITESSFNKFY